MPVIARIIKVNDELQKICEKAAMAYSEALFQPASATLILTRDFPNKEQECQSIVKGKAIPVAGLEGL
jgi:hypothetical protein